MTDQYRYSNDSSLKEESSLENENSDDNFSDYEPDAKNVEDSTLNQVDQILDK